MNQLIFAKTSINQPISTVQLKRRTRLTVSAVVRYLATTKIAMMEKSFVA